MYWILFAIGLFFAIVLESTGIALPWTLMLLLLTTIITKKQWLFLVGIVVGIFLDSVMFRPIGESSLFFVCLLGGIFLYERKFEMQSFPFVIGITALGSLSYFLFFGWQHIVLQLLLSILLCTGGFFLAMVLINPTS